MNEAKQEILENIQEALTNVPEDEQPADVEVPRSYRQEGNRGHQEVVDLFIARASEYKAAVNRIEEDELTETIAQSCRRENVEKLVASDKFRRDWLPDEVTPWIDHVESPLSNHKLDRSDGVITTCTGAVAQTGTIMLDASEGQGRRALSLLPDYHLCIIQANQIVELVPEGIASLKSSVEGHRAPITFISGPSATSDIELNRVEGVHGPRRLEVLIVA